MKRLSLFILILFLHNNQVQAQTYVTNNITADTIWGVGGSPYIVLNTIAVTQGVILTIEPGVTIKFETGVDVNILGTITARGDSNSFIIFTSNLPNPIPGVWGGVIIHPSSVSTSFIEYAQFDFGLSAVAIRNSAPTIQNCEMSQTLFSAVQIDGGAPLVLNNDIHSTKGASVFVGSGSAIIADNILHDNEQDGIHVGIPGSPIIHNNIIYGNTRYGINASTGSIILNNTIDSNGTAINCDNESPKIYNNIITNHPTIGIRAVNGGAPIPSYNDVWSNGRNYFGISPGVGDISSNPQFVNQSSRDYHLVSSSPCIDAGAPNSPMDPDSTRVDIGSFFFDQTITISVDIQPHSCPNHLTRRGSDILRVAIVGSATFDISTVDPTGVMLGGVQPISWFTQDVTTPINRIAPCECVTLGADGFSDLLFDFDKKSVWELVKVSDHEQGAILDLTGQVLNGPAIKGNDCIVVRAGKSSFAITTHTIKGLHNYPNPFNPMTSIEYVLIEASHVVLRIYNVHGQEVKKLVDKYQSPDLFRVVWDGTDQNFQTVPTGIYFARISTDSFQRAIRLFLLK